MPDRRQSLPRIHYVHPRHLGAIEIDGTLAEPWLKAVERTKTLGFAQMLIGQPVHGDPQHGLELLTAACAERGVDLWLDVSLADIGAGSEAAAQLPQWYVVPDASEGALDPRQPPLPKHRAQLVLRDGQVHQDWLDFWTDRLSRLVQAGVSGFNFLLPHRIPADAWRGLLDGLRSVSADLASANLSALAWTPGVPRESLAALHGVGFDHTFSSLAWWDFRSGWWREECELLRPAGQPAAFPESPYEITGVHAFADPVLRGRAARRSLWSAAALGEGWLMPMGFDTGSTLVADPFDPEAVPFSVPDAMLDLSADVVAANNWIATQSDRTVSVRPITGPDAGVTALWRMQAPAAQTEPNDPGSNYAVLINPDLHIGTELAWTLVQDRLPGLRRHVATKRSGVAAAAPQPVLLLEAGEAKVIELEPTSPVVTLAKSTRLAQRKRLAAALARPRVAIENIEPSVDGGQFALKRTPGQPVVVQADIFMDGHDKLAAAVLWKPADSTVWNRAPMVYVDNDRWEGRFAAERVGLHHYMVEAWRDTFATYRNELAKKHDAGVDVSVELTEVGRWVAEVLATAHADRDLDDATRGEAGDALKQVNDLTGSFLLHWLLTEHSARLIQRIDPREFASRSDMELPLNVERRAAEFASWYEIFPRSQSGSTERHGTFDDVIGRLPAIRDMGFDVLYFPPIHPIGLKNRKGRNNSLTALPGDPGSPYAIGSPDGGHDAIHPELGTLEDFRRLLGAASEHGLEIALDFAIQCSPDHPWLRDHPDWFAWRADGSIRYAENPPKKYEDIVNVDFYARDARGSDGPAGDLWAALRDVVLFWAKEGVRTFRVDNPHTKPYPFWQWLIAEVQGRYPDTLFLAEAFTRPKVMYRLAKAGFSQSYTYFTWRQTKQELTDYLVEISQPPVADIFRPHFFVNTPDINPEFLQVSGRAGFLIRAALAATLSGLWGLYNGFELCDATPVPGKEEYLNSEKYEIRAWDYQKPGNIIAEVTALNRIRADNPALQSHRGVTFLPMANPNLLAYTKATSERDNVVLVVVNLDPFAAQGANIELPLWEFGLPDDGTLHAEDLLRGYRFDWHGKNQYVWLETALPYAIWRISTRT